MEFNKIFIAFGTAVRNLNFDEHSCCSDVSMVLGADSGSNKLDFPYKDWRTKAFLNTKIMNVIYFAFLMIKSIFLKKK